MCILWTSSYVVDVVVVVVGVMDVVVVVVVVEDVVVVTHVDNEEQGEAGAKGEADVVE